MADGLEGYGEIASTYPRTYPKRWGGADEGEIKARSPTLILPALSPETRKAPLRPFVFFGLITNNSTPSVTA